MIAIGSAALHQHVNSRRVGDLDLLVTEAERSEIINSIPSREIVDRSPHKTLMYTVDRGLIEMEIISHSLSGTQYTEYIATLGLPTQEIKGVPVTVAPVDVLYSIKKSHIYYPVYFAKHIADYHTLKALCGGVDKLQDITRRRCDETKIWRGALKTPSLMKGSAEFFDDKVSNHTFVHDEIHAVMAHREKPMYTYIQSESGKVICSQALWDLLGEEDRIQCVLEEAYVIALERLIIPMLYKGGKGVSDEKAFNWALMRICTTLCSGWFRAYAVENHPKIVAAHDLGYVTKFLSAVESGKIIEIKHKHENK